jgi:hypothetical protein
VARSSASRVAIAFRAWAGAYSGTKYPTIWSPIVDHRAALTEDVDAGGVEAIDDRMRVGRTELSARGVDPRTSANSALMSISAPPFALDEPAHAETAVARILRAVACRSSRVTARMVRSTVAAQSSRRGGLGSRSQSARPARAAGSAPFR